MLIDLYFLLSKDDEVQTFPESNESSMKLNVLRIQKLILKRRQWIF